MNLLEDMMELCNDNLLGNFSFQQCVFGSQFVVLSLQLPSGERERERERKNIYEKEMEQQQQSLPKYFLSTRTSLTFFRSLF
jgi:hypothetical protein